MNGAVPKDALLMHRCAVEYDLGKTPCSGTYRVPGLSHVAVISGLEEKWFCLEEV